MKELNISGHRLSGTKEAIKALKQWMAERSNQIADLDSINIDKFMEKN